METLIYILKVNLYYIVFYVCYYILLRRHTFFRLNRLYLVSTLLLSPVFPLVELTETVRVRPPSIQTVPEPSVHLTAASPGLQTSWLQLTLIIYILGVVFMLVNLLRGFYGLYLLSKQGERIEMESYRLILLPETAATGRKLGSFSFFNFLVICHHDYETCFDTVLRHENVHITQRHSYDILLVEVLKAACWFNPVMWFYKYSLREIHEFLADQQAEDKEVYASFLVSYAQQAAYGSITNNFFNSILLKDRIKMIYSKSTSYWSLSKYVLIVPVMAFAVLKTAAHNQIFIKAERQLSIDHSDKVKESFKDPVPDPIAVIRKKRKVKPDTYNKISLRGNNEGVDTLLDKANQANLDYVSRVSRYQDSLWEAYDPKAGQINYYNEAKIKRIKPFYPALEKYGKEFGKSLDLSGKDAPKTHLQHFTLSVKSPYESYPTNVKKVIP
jgi:hypothetical protein